jgi:hypothetical protein
VLLGCQQGRTRLSISRVILRSLVVPADDTDTNGFLLCHLHSLGALEVIRVVLFDQCVLANGGLAG